MDYVLHNQQLTQTEEIAVQADQISALNWLTGEVALYVLLIIVSFGLRLANLGAYPLNDAEASQALVALEVFQGNIPAEVTGYSPLMVSLHSLAFLIFAPSDVSVRLGSVLLGVIFVLLPLGLHRQLGTMATLIASTLFAFSASSLFWSRVTAGEMGVAVGALMVLVGVVQWLEEGARFGLLLVIAGLVLLLTSAPSGFTALVILLLLCGLIALTNRKALSVVQERFNQSRVTVGQAALGGVGLLVVLGTAALFNLTGLAAVSDMFNTWLSQFGLTWQAGAGYPAILMLLFYEPVIVIFGLAGIIRSFKNQRLLDWVLVIWLGAIITLDLLMGGRSRGQVLLALIPLTLLASQSISRLLEQIFTEAHLEAEGLFIGFGLVLSGFFYITLTSWSKCLPNLAGCNTAWVLPAAGLALLTALFIIFWGWYGPEVAWRGVGVLLLLTVGLFSIGASWRLNYGPLKDLPFQPMISQPASTRLLTLLEDLSRLSAEETGDTHQLDLAVVDLERPVLHWYLRDFAHVRYVSSFAAADGAAVIVSGSETGEPVDDSYVGQDLAMISQWTPQLVEGKDWVRWYLFRFLPNHIPGSDQVILWVRQG